MHFHDFTKKLASVGRAFALVGLLASAANAGLVLPDLPTAKNPSSSDEKRAQSSYGKAYEAYGNGNAEQALRYADQAFSALPNASTALIRATILQGLERNQKAFVAYLIAADLNPVPDELHLIDQGLAATGASLSPPMGWVSFKTTPAGARVSLGEGSFKAPRTAGLPAGQHFFNIQSPGFVGTQGNVSVSAGRGSNLSFALATEQRQQAVVQTAPTPIATAPPISPRQTAPVRTAKSLPEKNHALAYSMMSLGGAALVGGAVSYMGVVSSVEEADAANAAADKPLYDEKIAEAQTSQMMGIGLLVVGAAGLGYGLWDLMSAPEGADTAWNATALPFNGGGAVVLSGSF